MPEIMLVSKLLHWISMFLNCPFVFSGFWVLYRKLSSIHIGFYQVVNVKGQSVLFVSLETIFWFLWTQLEGILQAYYFSPPPVGKLQNPKENGFHSSIVFNWLLWSVAVHGLDIFKICFKMFYAHPTLCLTMSILREICSNSWCRQFFIAILL